MAILEYTLFWTTLSDVSTSPFARMASGVYCFSISGGLQITLWSAVDLSLRWRAVESEVLLFPHLDG